MSLLPLEFPRGFSSGAFGGCPCAGLPGLPGSIGGAFQGLFPSNGGFSTGSGELADSFGAVFQQVPGLFAQGLNPLPDKLQQGLSGLPGAFEPFLGGLQGILGNAVGGFGGIVNSLLGAIGGGGGGGIGGILKSAGIGILKSVGGSILESVGGGILDSIGSFFSGFFLAGGGVVSGSGMAPLARGGPGAFVPLPDGRQIPASLTGDGRTPSGGAGGDRSQTIVVNLDARDPEAGVERKTLEILARTRPAMVAEAVARSTANVVALANRGGSFAKAVGRR